MEIRPQDLRRGLVRLKLWIVPLRPVGTWRTIWIMESCEYEWKRVEMGHIRIDGRVGSGHYLPLLNNLHPRIAIRATLPFGDAAFSGNGPDGRVLIGVEIKKLRDLLNSMISGRLAAHQLPGMMQSYTHSWLVIEGIWRFDYDTGVLMVPKQKSWFKHKNGGARVWEPLSLGNRKFSIKDIGGFLTSLQIFGGVHVHLTSTDRDTALFLWNLHRWWSKPWSAHKTPLTIRPSAPAGCSLRKPSLVAQVAAAIPGVGPKKAHAAAREFGTVKEMVGASVERWAGVDGVGEVIAKRVYKLLRGRRP